jgi:hypothetical protein
VNISVSAKTSSEPDRVSSEAAVVAADSMVIEGWLAESNVIRDSPSEFL